MASAQHIVEVALPIPLNRLFDYLPASRVMLDRLKPGIRVCVPFGRRTVVGVVISIKDDSEFPLSKIKPIDHVLEVEPSLDAHLLKLTQWMHRYYHVAWGEVIQTALPKLLRQSKSMPELSKPFRWVLNLERSDDFKALRGIRQQQVVALLDEHCNGLEDADFRRQGIGSDVIRRMHRSHFIKKRVVEPTIRKPEAGPELNAEQAQAVQEITAQMKGFSVTLLDGITGSGKTEVYLELLRAVIVNGGQGLVLVPEIGLTPQLRDRFERRLACRVAVLHSELTDLERLKVWDDARSGRLDVVIGTRSALFTPLLQLSLIIVDEEHDTSLKQQDGIRYSGRDVAIQRANMLKLPIILGSATPSLESLANVEKHRFKTAKLTHRAVEGAVLPRVRRVDLRADQSEEGLSAQLKQEIQHCLARNEQALLFLNRRGFAPTLMCHSCGWYGECPRCDSRLTMHAKEGCLRCHHCAYQVRIPRSCPSCGAFKLEALGEGTERLEKMLKKSFATYPVIRIDRDSIRTKGAFEQQIKRINQGEACILIGTQMLAKGHDFPKVSLVGVINLDQVLFSSDFRAAERAAQLLVQVAGRAGRGEHPGLVCIQSFHPEHPLYTELFEQGYAQFAQQLLIERKAARFPPYAHMAILRAQSPQKKALDDFFEAIMHQLEVPTTLSVFGPFPAPMERLAGRYRMQVMLICEQRSVLHGFLDHWLANIQAHKASARVRWNIDIDPADTY